MRQFNAALSAALLATMLGLAAGAVPARAEDGATQCPGNPDALGTSRVIAIDSDQLKRIGRMQYPELLAARRQGSRAYFR